jgi:hypothetical protein
MHSKTIVMQNQFSVDSKLIQSWVDANLDPAEVEKKLQVDGFSEQDIAAYLQAYRKERYAGRRFNGFLYAGIGAALGLVSCLLSIFNPFPALYGIILFGLTSIAVLLVLIGLYFLFE